MPLPNDIGHIALCLVILAILVWAARRSFLSPNIITRIPGPKASSWIYGNMPELLLSKEYGEHEFQWQETYGPVYSLQGCFWAGGSPFALGLHIIHSSVFVWGASQRKVANLLLGYGNIFLTQGDMHRHLRNIMNPWFSAQSVREALPVIQDTARTLVDRWESSGFPGKTVDISRSLHDAALDVMGEAILEYSFSAQAGKSEPSGLQRIIIDSVSTLTELSLLADAVIPYVPDPIFRLACRLPLPGMLMVKRYNELTDGLSRHLVQQKRDDGRVGIDHSFISRLKLIDAIVEKVSDSSLVACSLASTAFVPHSQRRLFRSMSLSGVEAYERIALVLTSSPHLGTYVRNLALDIKEVPKRYAQLKTILLLLPEIERLSIAGNINATGNQLRQNPCLLDFISLPSLKCFALDGIHDIPTSFVLRAFSSFEQVSLSCLYIANQEDQASIVSRSPTIRHLRISMEAYHSIIPFLLAPGRFVHLKHLTRLSIIFAPIPDELRETFVALIAACSRTLEHLELELDVPLELPELPALSSMHLWIDVGLAKTPQLLASIVSQTAACVPHLTVLSLSLIDRPKNYPVRQLPFTRSAAEWPDLDSALMDLRDLRQVFFSLRYFVRSAERYASFVPYIEQKLPRAFDAELLRFSQHAAVEHPMDCFTE
ncbi:cytochrome P450 [Mycena rosella]|uniref:Cytochrome P450 n=1 Tax=Mycena rosella TaxID=1033263 RepID=A0AAD7DDR8_MYCRO|nr:cytochrome P450 [Mycena rosella]